MSIPVVCPGCKGRLSAPDGAAGKRVRCPKPACGAAIEVPVPGAPPALDDEGPRAVDDDARQPARRRSEDRPARDTHDDDDDRPADRRRPRKAGPSAGLIIGIVAGSVVLLAVAGVGVYKLVDRRNANAPVMSGSGPSRAPMSGQWSEYRSDEDHFRGRFPGVMSKERTNDRENEYDAFGPGDRVRMVLTVITFPPGTTPRDRQREAADRIAGLRLDGRVVWEKEVRYLGRDATDLRIELEDERDGHGNMVRPVMAARVFFTDERLYVLTIDSADSASLDADARTLFDNFELLP